MLYMIMYKPTHDGIYVRKGTRKYKNLDNAIKACDKLLPKAYVYAYPGNIVIHINKPQFDVSILMQKPELTYDENLISKTFV